MLLLNVKCALFIFRIYFSQFKQVFSPAIDVVQWIVILHTAACEFVELITEPRSSLIQS